MPEPLPHDGIDLPAHPDRAEDPTPVTDGSRLGGIIVVVLFGALVALIVLHLTGVVGPRAH
jgi:hypothetical protein